MKRVNKIYFTLAVIVLAATAMLTTSCGVYKFSEATVADSIKTVNVGFIENRARLVNPQLSPKLTDKLRQKIVSQTKLTQVNNDKADWEITGTITDYSLSTTAISNQREVNNRLTVGVHISVNDRRSDLPPKEYDVSRGFEFSAQKSLQQAENELLEEMIRTLTDEIFNKLFSNW